MGITPSEGSAEDLADEIWQVRLPNGSVQAMSIEEVESAFTRGELDLGTKVQRPSGGTWVSIAEAAGMAGDSITPMTVATDIHAPNIPRPAPLPVDDDAPLSAAELYSVTPRGGFSNLVGVMGAAALLIGGFVAWHYLPAHPIPSLATTTIMAPPETAAAAVAPPPVAAQPELQITPSPETSPAPEGNALTDAKIAQAPAPAKKAAPAVNKGKKKPALKKPESVTTFTVRKHTVVKSQ